MSNSCATPSIMSILTLFVSLACAPQQSGAQQIKKPFAVADDIGMTLFWPVGLMQQTIHFSPDGKYFAVYTERGRLDLNCVEDSLRFYRSRDIEKFWDHSDDLQPPSPVWIVNRSDKEGPVINNWRWLPDSSGVAFLDGGGVSNNRLLLADLRKKVIEPLTSATEKVKSFDIRDRQHYVYSITDPAPRQKMLRERQAAAIVGTGRSALELIFPDDPLTALMLSNRDCLWAVVGGKRFEVANDGTLFLSAGDFALSPDGQSVITQQVVPRVPTSWEDLYPPPFASYQDQNPNTC